MKKQFNCYSYRLAGFLLLKQVGLVKVTKTADNRWLFIFDNDYGVCDRLLEEYREIA